MYNNTSRKLSTLPSTIFDSDPNPLNKGFGEVTFNNYNFSSLSNYVSLFSKDSMTGCATILKFDVLNGISWNDQSVSALTVVEVISSIGKMLDIQLLNASFRSQNDQLLMELAEKCDVTAQVSANVSFRGFQGYLICLFR